MDHVDLVSFFVDILHNQGCILDLQASLHQNQQQLQACIYKFEAQMAHMESHIHDAFHHRANKHTMENYPIEKISHDETKFPNISMCAVCIS